MVDASTFTTTSEWLRVRHKEHKFKSHRNAGTTIGVDRVVYGDYLDGVKVPPDELVSRLADYYGDDEEAMLALARRSRRARRRPAIDRVAASAALDDHVEMLDLAMAILAELKAQIVAGRITHVEARGMLDRGNPPPDDPPAVLPPAPPGG